MIKTKKIVSLPKLLKKAQDVFNRWIRERDKDLPCICCGSYNASEAGHYRSQGHYGSLRFNEMNVNLCCTRCNCFLHGNLIEYRKGLIKKYGEERVLMLENVKSYKKWSRFELEAIIEMYKDFS
jgi:hypothetical protein